MRMSDDFGIASSLAWRLASARSHVSGVGARLFLVEVLGADRETGFATWRELPGLTRLELVFFRLSFFLAGAVMECLWLSM